MSGFQYSAIKEYYDRDYWDTPGVKSGYVGMTRSVGGPWHSQACGWFNSVIPVKGKTLLDAGCGLGHFMVGFKALGAHVQGVDPSDYCVDFVHIRLGLPIFQTTIETMRKVPRHYFQIVYCGATLEHIPDEYIPNALHNLAAVAAPGGLIFLEIDTTPDNQREMPEESHVNIKPWSAWLWDITQPFLPWFVREDLSAELHKTKDFPGFPLPAWSFIVLEKILP